jgi:hypothetical protein
VSEIERREPLYREALNPWMRTAGVEPARVAPQGRRAFGPSHLSGPSHLRPAHRIAEPVDHSHDQRVCQGLTDRSALAIAPHYQNFGRLALVRQRQVSSTARGNACGEEREECSRDRGGWKRHRVTSRRGPRSRLVGDRVRQHELVPEPQAAWSSSPTSGEPRKHKSTSHDSWRFGGIPKTLLQRTHEGQGLGKDRSSVVVGGPAEPCETSVVQSAQTPSGRCP